ncbi:13504_t:CDS:10 [Entrophospora sp. SA101]|nr:13504_t:CDS:10 [Entrophospora sp. SA101]
MLNLGVHVIHILLAEFDIDKGSSLTHQYPVATGTAENLLAELMLPDGAHLRTEDWTVFFLNQKTPDPDKIISSSLDEINVTKDEDEDNMPLLYALNLVRTKYDKEARRGAVVKAMAICTRHQYLHIYKMDVNNMPHFSPHEKVILRTSENKDIFEEKFSTFETNKHESSETTLNLNKNKDRHFFETKILYNGIKLPIRVPLTVNPEEVGDFSLIKLITTFTPSSPTTFTHPFHPHLDSSGNQTHPIILLLNALLTQKRIIFLGQGHPSGEVANYVLSACAMGSGSGGVLRGFTERAFPYTNLTNVDDLLKVPGFIAGVTNRIFEDHSSWWDVLCNIDTGKITVSKDISTPSYGTNPDERLDESTKSPASSKSESWGRDKWDTTDNEFMAEVMHAIQHHYGETTIRCKFQEYVQRFVRLTALYEVETFGSTKIDMMPENTDHGGILGTGLAFQDENSKLREVATNVNLSKLKNLKNMQEEEVETLYKALMTNVVTDEQIIEFLSYLPQNQGGLFPIGFGLFYPLKSVRNYTIELFNRINTHTTGSKFILSLNYFQKFAYERQLANLHEKQQQIEMASRMSQQGFDDTDNGEMVMAQ